MEALESNLHLCVVNITHKLNTNSGSYVALVFLTLLQKQNGHRAISVPKNIGNGEFPKELSRYAKILKKDY